MKINLLKPHYLNKDGSVNYKRASNALNMSQNDLRYFYTNNFGLIDSATLMTGVLVACRPTSQNPIFYAPWNFKTCYHSNNDLSYIYNLVIKPAYIPDWETYDYFIMDASGHVLYKNFDFDKTIDKNGVIHLSSSQHDLDKLVYPATKTNYHYKHYFCYGRTIEELNDHIKNMAGAKLIKRPKNFKKGFSQAQNIEKEKI